MTGNYNEKAGVILNGMMFIPCVMKMSPLVIKFMGAAR